MLLKNVRLVTDMQRDFPVEMAFHEQSTIKMQTNETEFRALAETERKNKTPVFVAVCVICTFL